MTSQAQNLHARRSLGLALLLVGYPLACTVYDTSLKGDDSPLISEGGASGKGGSGAGGTRPDVGGTSAAQAGTSSAGLGGAADGGEGGDSGGGEGGVAGEPSAGSAGQAAGSGGVAGGGSGGVAGSGGAGTSGSGGSSVGPRELAAGKAAKSSTQEAAHTAAMGNDNDTGTRWCAINGVFPQWWRVDLGATYELKQVSLRFEHMDRTYNYTVETSLNDMVYTQRLMADGTGPVQALDFPPATTGRYVRVTVTSAVPVSVNGNGTWASFYEMSVTGL